MTQLTSTTTEIPNRFIVIYNYGSWENCDASWTFKKDILLTP